MTKDELLLLLNQAAAYDGREIDRADVIAWHKLVGHFTNAEAERAVEDHYRTETRRLMPADIFRYVMTEREQWLNRHPETGPDTPLPWEERRAVT